MQPSQPRAILNGIEDDSALLKREGDSTENMAHEKKGQPRAAKPVSMKILADYLGLCPATVSLVMKNVTGRSIPQETRERVSAAARKFTYHTSILSRSWRTHRTFTVCVLVPDYSAG